MYAALPLEHYKMVLEMQRAIVNHREVGELWRVLDDAYPAGNQVAFARVGIEVKRSMSIHVARLNAVEVMRQFLPVFND